MSLIAGIDYSTRAVDVVFVDEDTGAAAWKRYPLEADGDAFDRARAVRQAMPARGWWKFYGVIAVGIEDPRGYATGLLYRIQGGILQCLPADLLVKPWIPSEWRRANNIAGNASKHDVQLHSLRLVGTSRATDAWPQDAHDAHLIARATRSALQYPEAA